MSIVARLHLDQHPLSQRGIRVLSYNFGFSQEIDSNGLPGSRVRAGLINLTVYGKSDPDLVNWMLGRMMTKNGKIVFTGISDSGIPLETNSLAFENGILVSYGESFNDQSDMIISLSISCQKITLSNAKWETKWDFDKGA